MQNGEKRIAPFVKQLARAGCVSTAIVYLMIGVISLLSLFRLKQGGADEASLMKFLYDVPFGKIIIWIILLGMVAYMIWRFYEAIKDPYDYGREWKGMVIRIITAFSAISDGLIAWPAIEALLGNSTAMKNGEPVAQRQQFAELLEKESGTWIVGALGLITSITAITQFLYAIKKVYEERIDMKPLKPAKRKFIHVVSWAGQFARGIILGIIGFFMLKAALTRNAQYVVNTDKAFDFIGDEISPVVFAIVAFGTICYGVFMLVLAYYYDFTKGK